MTAIDGTDLALATVGLTLGVVVTWQLHVDPRPGFWGERLGGGRFRRSDLPVGGSLGLLASLLLEGARARRLRALSAGAALAPPLIGILDPLPPV